MFLYMKENEITASFKRADKKRIQIEILAQLNICSMEDIVAVLLRNGVSRKELPPKYRKIECDMDFDVIYK